MRTSKPPAFVCSQNVIGAFTVACATTTANSRRSGNEATEEIVCATVALCHGHENERRESGSADDEDAGYVGLEDSPIRHERLCRHHEWETDQVRDAVREYDEPRDRVRAKPGFQGR